MKNKKKVKVMIRRSLLQPCGGCAPDAFAWFDLTRRM